MEYRTAWLFPGQGSQFVGMGRDLCSGFPPAARILELASELSGLPLARYCWQGPRELLDRTDVLQPAVTAINLGCLALLRESGVAPDVVAGHSLGEYSALCAAGVLQMEDALRLVVERGRIMQVEARTHPGGMLAVQGLAAAQVDEIVLSLRERFTLSIANYNAPEQTVLSGEEGGLSAAAVLAAARGGRTVRLQVSGAWHSPLMQGARERFAPAIDRVRFDAPTIPIYLNTAAGPQSDPARLREAMRAQIAQPVLWLQVVQRMIDDGVNEFVEVGPGKVLRGLLRKIWSGTAPNRLVGVDGRRPPPRHVPAVAAGADR